MVVDKLDGHNQLLVVVVFGNQGTGAAHTLEVPGVPMVECKRGVGLGMLLHEGKVEAYHLVQDKVPWEEGDDYQWDNPLQVGLVGMVSLAGCLDTSYQTGALGMH